MAGLILFAIVGASVERRFAEPASAQDTAVLLPVAMYHSVTDQGESPGEYVISPSMLEKDLQYLSQHGYETVVVGDLVSHVEKGKERGVFGGNNSKKIYSTSWFRSK